MASIFESVDPALRHAASVSSFMPEPLPIAVKAERQYGQPLISETAIAIWYRVSNGNTPPSSVAERPRKPSSPAGEWAIVLKEFGAAPYLPYLLITASSSSFAF